MKVQSFLDDQDDVVGVGQPTGLAMLNHFIIPTLFYMSSWNGQQERSFPTQAVDIQEMTDVHCVFKKN